MISRCMYFTTYDLKFLRVLFLLFLGCRVYASYPCRFFFGTVNIVIGWRSISEMTTVVGKTTWSMGLPKASGKRDIRDAHLHSVLGPQHPHAARLRRG